MKIVNVVYDFNVGGIQKLLLEYLRYFKNSEIDYQVVVLSPNQNSNFDIICKNEKLNIHYLNCCFSNNNHYYIRKYLKWYRFNFRLLKYLKKEKPDLVHTHNTRMLNLIETCIKKTHKKYKWFHTLHSDPYAVHESHIPVAKRVFEKYGVKTICLNETQFLKAKERYGLSKCLYLYNAINFNKLKKDVINKIIFRNSLGIKDDDYVMGAVGRLDPVKNYPFMLKVFKEILKYNNNSILLIAGGGSNEDFEKLNSYATENGFKDKLLLLGNRTDVQNIYNIVDIFTQTSLTEASPLTIIEAQSMNCKCVVSNAIPKESVCFQNRVVRLSLNESLDTWVREVLNPTRFEKQYSNLKDYSIEELSKKLIKMYLEN